MISQTPKQNSTKLGKLRNAFSRIGAMASASKLRFAAFLLLSLAMSAILAHSLFSISSGGSSVLSAKAVNATKFLSAQETRALYGDTITAQVYYDGSYHNVTFQYLDNHTSTPAGLNQIVPAGTSSFGNWPAVEYVCFDTGNVTASQDTVTVYLNPQYSVFNTENFSTFVALSTEQDVPSSVYDSSAWDFFGTLGAQTFYSPISYENGAQNGMYSTSQMFSESYPHDNKVIAIPVDIQETRTFSISSIECRFRGCTPWWDYNNNRMYLYIGCPRVDDVSSYSSGTMTETTASTGGGGSSGDVNVTVIVNNSEIVQKLDEQAAANSAYQESMLHHDIETGTTFETVPEQLYTAMSAPDEVIEDMGDYISNTGFWLAMLGWLFSLLQPIKVVAPFFVLLSIMAYVWWRK